MLELLNSMLWVLQLGLAKSGMVPVLPLYSSFIQRAYDQLIHDIAILNLPVVICSDRSGIVGNDGETHQGLLDMAFTNIIPNFTIMAPKDFAELENMLEFAVNLKKPVLIRYPRGSEEISFDKNEKIYLGKSETLKKGEDIALIGIGKFVAKAYNVAEKLKENKINATVINARFLKPIDEYNILNQIKKCKIVATFEDGTLQGGLGNQIERIAFENKINCEVIKFGYPDEFVKHGNCSEIEQKYGLDEESVIEKILEIKNELFEARNGKICLKILEKKKQGQMKESF